MRYAPHRPPRPLLLPFRPLLHTIRILPARRRAAPSFFREELIEELGLRWARSSTPRSTSTTPTSTGTSSFRRRSPSSSPRIAFSPRTSGARSECSRAAGGCTTRSTGRSRTSCCSAARSTSSSSRRRPRLQRRRCCPSDCPLHAAMAATRG
uniref:Uncharacterized protein n=1 Tax=Oryza barthii TaxID=65489 RepID=A0A0D3FDS6_9ORYZ